MGGPDSTLPDGPAERVLWEVTLDLASPATALRLARHLDTWLWPDTPPELPETWVADLNTATIAATALDASVQHPLRPLIRAYLDAHRPAAKPDRWSRATMPRLVTSERAGELARLELADDAANAPAMAPPAHLPGLGRVGALASAPTLAYLPGFAPADVPDRIIPASWLRLIDELARTERDTRDWQRDKARRGTLAALERLAVDGALAYDAAGRGRRRRLALWRPGWSCRPPMRRPTAVRGRVLAYLTGSGWPTSHARALLTGLH